MKRINMPLPGALVFALISAVGPIAQYAWADDHVDSISSQHHMMEAGESHSHHQHMMMSEAKISMAAYELPQVKLVRDDGKIASLKEELNDGLPVIMNFIFTSCTTICPVSSRTLSVFQEKLGNQRDKIHIISISTDPEQDTQSVLKKYASKYEAGPEWHFYTGTREASLATQQAFDVLRGDKMDQPPVTLLRAAPGKPWLRIEGFTTADDLLNEYRKLIVSQSNS